MEKLPLAGTALIADDDEYFRMAMSAVLKQLGFTVVIEADSFEGALECLAATGQFDLAAFDLNMPGIDSPAALRAVRDLFPVRRVVVVSASTARADVLSSLEAGAHGFISKGQGVRALQDGLRQVMEGGVYVPPNLAELPPKPQDPPPPGKAHVTENKNTRLSRRQRDVLEMLVQGKGNKEIARSLDMGAGTVKVHLAALYRALGVSNRSSAAVAGADLLRRLH